MYIKLGKSNIVNHSDSYDNFMVFSEVIGSQVSYEKPILLHTTQELDMWFGSDYTDYQFLRFLLESGVALYLYKPISEKGDKKHPDISGYNCDPNTFYNQNLEPQIKQQVGSKIIITGLPKVGTKETIYQVLDFENGKYVRDNIRYSKWVWTNNGEYANYDTFYSDVNSSSLDNRDTLYVLSDGNAVTPQYTTPLSLTFYMLKEENKWNMVLGNDRIIKYHYKSLEDLNNSKISFSAGETASLDWLPVKEYPSLDYHTLAWKINTEATIERSYLIIQRDDQYYMFRGPGDSNEVTGIINHYRETLEVREFDSIGSLEDKLQEIGFIVRDHIVYSLTPCDITYFNTSLLEPSPIDTQNILYAGLGYKAIIKFWSKTIGYDETKIHVKIEDTEDGEKRITISKNGYYEVYETGGLERVDYQISKNSKLVYCEILKEDQPIPTGDWDMGGSILEEQDEGMYDKGIESLEDNQNLPVDFIMVPNIDKYSSTDFLEVAKNLNCQILLQNTENNYENNIIDPDNRLIYFYKSMIVQGDEMPGYYLFLLGLLGDVYSMTSSTLLYDCPSEFNPSEIRMLEKKDGSIEKKLKDYKSNYLTYNGQYYFYDQYFNGDQYTSTCLMRFAVSKISREIEKNSWTLIGDRTNLGGIMNRFKTMINQVKNSFSIIYSMELTDFLVDDTENKVKLSIKTQINDLVKSDMIINLTVDYKQSNLI